MNLSELLTIPCLDTSETYKKKTEESKRRLDKLYNQTLRDSLNLIIQSQNPKESNGQK